tara:strand:+ start:589 stop:918 length:330 start_codon:yes stop_codon:yes gene_type:complete
MVDYNSVYTLEGVTKTEITGDEKTQLEAKRQTIADNLPNEKLELIKLIRLQKLKETDYLATSDNVMSDEIKAFRKSMRDVPQDYLADKYDELLFRNEQGKLTHPVWEKP